MILKRILLLIFLLFTLSGCVQNTAFLGPAYTFASSGNIYQAGLSYGSEKAVNKFTGKSTGENIKEMLIIKEKDSEFQQLVKKRILETRKKLSLSNQ
jgi:hypothetical protein